MSAAGRSSPATVPSKEVPVVHIIVGLIMFVLGFWGLLTNWHGFVDLLWAIVPLLLAIGGLVAVVSGIIHFKRVR